MNNKLLVAKSITKIYNLGEKNENKVLKEISLEINSGEFVCVMGSSGSGKTTLINNLSTIDIPTKGDILIEGKNVKNMSEKELCDFRTEKLGFVFQSFNIIESLNNYDNISLPLLLTKIDKNEIKERINEICEKLNIQNIIQKYPRECSGGEIQRVAIARAIISKPKLIIADEPTGNLDSNNSCDLLDILSNLNKDGITILMVTHDPFIASYSSRFLYIKDGVIMHEIKRGDMSQKDYYLKIDDICSNAYKKILNKGEILNEKK
ncbi:MAG: ABC transporter ATP-binding protein [Longibaculum sp.]